MTVNQLPRALSLISCLALVVAPAMAQEPLAEPDAPEVMIEDCLSQPGPGLEREVACIGVMTGACLVDAITTVEMLGCYAPETDVWETRMMTAYEQLRAAYAEQDADEDPVRALAPRLESVQAQWSAWRDAKCGFQYDQYRGGSLGRIALADCRLSETAQRALDLEALLSDVQ